MNWNSDRVEQKKKICMCECLENGGVEGAGAGVATIGKEIRQGRRLELVPWNKNKRVATVEGRWGKF